MGRGVTESKERQRKVRHKKERGYGGGGERQEGRVEEETKG
jgi:hypothetical protein